MSEESRVVDSYLMKDSVVSVDESECVIVYNPPKSAYKESVYVTKHFMTPQAMDAALEFSAEAEKRVRALSHDRHPSVNHVDDWMCISHDSKRFDVWPDSRKHRLAELLDPLVTEQLRTFGGPKVNLRPGTIGVLPTYGGAGAGRWHMDAVQLFEDPSYEIGRFIPDTFYANTIIPLCNVSREMGPTKFLLTPTQEAYYLGLSPTRKFIAVFDMERGDAVTFTGSVVHCGGANTTEQTRTAIYAVWTAPWYNEVYN